MVGVRTWDGELGAEVGGVTNPGVALRFVSGVTE